MTFYFFSKSAPAILIVGGPTRQIINSKSKTQIIITGCALGSLALNLGANLSANLSANLCANPRTNQMASELKRLSIVWPIFVVLYARSRPRSYCPPVYLFRYSWSVRCHDRARIPATLFQHRLGGQIPSFWKESDLPTARERLQAAVVSHQ